MSSAAQSQAQTGRKSNQDIGFAAGIVLILTLLFLPLPSILIDIGLAFSIALSVVILMVALWIQRPLEFSAFPTVLLIATLLRLALNIATTRLILSQGHEGHDAAGYVIAGFASFVIGGDFLIGVIVFMILITVNFLVITKGATRIAEVGARFTLDAIPGKQMAIDADLSAGLIDDKEAMRRRRELEEESAFFGAMDGASKFVRGDAIAGLIITAINVVGGILIGILRHDMPASQAADVFVKLSIGDGLVTQIPALIVSLAAGLLVSKGGTRGSAEKAVFAQLSTYPRALLVSGSVIGALSLAPGLPFLPFAVLGTALILVSYLQPRRLAMVEAAAAAEAERAAIDTEETARVSLKQSVKVSEIELCFGRHVSAAFLANETALADRVRKMRFRFAKQYGFIIPEIKVTNDVTLHPRVYTIKIHGAVCAQYQLRFGDVLVITKAKTIEGVPCDPVREPAFGLDAFWVPETFATALKREGYDVIDCQSVLLTHVAETLRAHLAQIFSYRDVRQILDNLEPEYKRLVDEVVPSCLTYSGLHAILRSLLNERISIRRITLILEAVAEVAPRVRQQDQIVEHVRYRLSAQICDDFADDGKLKFMRIGQQWEEAFASAIRKDINGQVIEFLMSPQAVESFGSSLKDAVEQISKEHQALVLVTRPDLRSCVRMVTERLYPHIPVLSTLELAKSATLVHVGSVG